MLETNEVELCARYDALIHFVESALLAAGAAEDPAQSVARALAGASLRGVDSHGVRLLPHYCRVVQGGRINGAPRLSIERPSPAVAVVDADNGFGHHASYAAITEGVDLARTNGIAAVSVINSSHFGAAGCYVLEAAEQGFVALGFSNSDSLVLPHDGTQPFHGTNPLAFAAPVMGERPFLLDMATSIVPWNRIQDYRTKGLKVPEDTGVDAMGQMTTDPEKVHALLPVGALQHGYKGAGLASMLEVFSAVLTGMPHCSQLLSMASGDISTPRHLGHFFIVINPSAFVPKPIYDIGMAAYLADLRASPARANSKVMAPGDREWQRSDDRSENGIPVSPGLNLEFKTLAHALGIACPDYIQRR
jgi:ureidoglycolate dehydrogenase (NAD+)